MYRVYFGADLHLGHETVATLRGFSSVEEHDDTIMENLLSACSSKKTKLFLLGDVAFHRGALERLVEIPCNIEFIFGNHDKANEDAYQMIFKKVHGFKKYKNFFLSHCPIHPQELFRVRGNIHGHIHKFGITENLPMPYYNVNIEFHDLKPVKLETIKEAFTEYEETLDKPEVE